MLQALRELSSAHAEGLLSDEEMATTRAAILAKATAPAHDISAIAGKIMSSLACERVGERFARALRARLSTHAPSFAPRGGGRTGWLTTSP